MALLSFKNLLGFVCEVRKGPRRGASVLVEFEASTLPAHGSLYQPAALGATPLTRGVPSLQDAKPDDPRWSDCHSGRNKARNECDVLESP